MSNKEISKSTGAVTKDLVRTIRSNRKTGIPTFVFGAPGVGKSQQVFQAADGGKVIDIRLSTLDPVDLRGLPTVNATVDGKEVDWARPDFIPKDGEGIIFFDELNTAPIAVQNAALQLILDRRIGPHRIPDGWYMVAAGNKASHRAHVNPMGAPLRNRFAVVEYVPTVEHWTRWAMANEVHDNIIAFLNFQNGYLTTEPNDEYANFASPRSWAYMSAFLKAGIDDGESYTQIIGRGAAVAFSAFQEEINEMPNIDDLIAGKAKFDHNGKRISVSYAVAMALASRLLNSTDGKKRSDDQLNRCNEIAASLPSEIAVLYFAYITNCNDRSLKNRAMQSKVALEWARKHRPLLLKYGVTFRNGESDSSNT